MEEWKKYYRRLMWESMLDELNSMDEAEVDFFIENCDGWTLAFEYTKRFDIKSLNVLVFEEDIRNKMMERGFFGDEEDEDWDDED